MRFCHLLLVICFLMVFLFPSTPAQAVSPTDQSCSLIPATSAYTFLSHEPAQVFVPTKNTLDAVSVFVKADIGLTANLKAEVINATSSPGDVIASKTQIISNAGSWVLFDFSDAPMPQGIYAIALVDADVNSHAVWFHGPANCYDRGYAVYDNQGHLELDYRFAVNAYDIATSNQSSSGSATSGSSGTSNSGNQSKSSSGTSSIKKPSNPNIASIASQDPELAKFLAQEQQRVNEASGGAGILGFFLGKIIWLAIFFFIALFLIIIGIIVVFSKAKKQIK